MAKFSLIPFDPQSAPKIYIESELNKTNESIFISYKLQGDLSSIELGDGNPKHAREIKLWEKTCFELFIKDNNNSYIEFNFSPDFEWNCFYFEKKGNALEEYKKMELVKFDILFSNEVVHVIVELHNNMFPDHFFDGSLSAGISSVIKSKNGILSYWALSHEDQRPNFHHFDSFKCKF
jgi:glutaredoxin-related protein